MGSIDIHPEEILAVERYSYKTVIQKNDFTEIFAKPFGLVIIKMPYDGEHFFPMQSAEALKQKKDLDQLRIGSLAIGEPKDWNESWGQQIGTNIFDVDIPLRTLNLTETQWTSDELMIHFQQDYPVGAPKYFPIRIYLEVLDHAAISRFMRSKLKVGDDFWKNLSDRSSAISRDDILSFEMHIEVSLPTILLQKESSVSLEKFVLHWPKIPPKSQFQIFQLDFKDGSWKSMTWDYEPESSEIVLPGSEMDRVNPKNGSPLTIFQALLHIDLMYSSGALIQDDQLEGKAVVRVNDTLLSGRDVAWVNMMGERTTNFPKLTKRTILEAAYVASLRDQSAVKVSLISRVWLFPGVSLTDERVDDVTAVLLDIGYSVVPQEANKGHLVFQRRVNRHLQEPAEIQAWIELSGTDRTDRPQTKRERKTTEEDTYTTEIYTQELTIKFYGLVNGSAKILAADAEEIMIRLKDQFAAVADLR